MAETLTDAQRAYLQAELEHWGQSLLDNEGLGERRLNILLGLVTGVLGLLGAAAAEDQLAQVWALGVALLVALLGFGVVTQRRMVQRSKESAKMRRVLAEIRKKVLGDEAAGSIFAAVAGAHTVPSAEKMRARGSMAIQVHAINIGLGGALGWLLMVGLCVSVRTPPPAWVQPLGGAAGLVVASFLGLVHLESSVAAARDDTTTR